MNIELTARNYEPTKRVRNSVEEKAEKFTKYASDLQQVRFTLTGEKVDFVCDINLHCFGKDFHTSADADDMLVALDRASSSMEQQLRRYKDKHSGHRHSNHAGPTSAAQLESSLSSSDTDGSDDDR